MFEKNLQEVQAENLRGLNQTKITHSFQKIYLQFTEDFRGTVSIRLLQKWPSNDILSVLRGYNENFATTFRKFSDIFKVAIQ